MTEVILITTLFILGLVSVGTGIYTIRYSLRSPQSPSPTKSHSIIEFYGGTLPKHTWSCRCGYVWIWYGREQEKRWLVSTLEKEHSKC